MLYSFQQKPVLLIDLSNIVYRARSVTEDGAVTMLFRMIAKLRRRHDTRQFVYATEGRGVVQRQRIDPDYKASRNVDDAYNQLRSLVTRALEHTRCVMIRAPKGEADDAIATYVRQHPDRDIVILSEDRDLWQLIASNVRIAATVKGKHAVIDTFACRRLLGVDPSRVANLKALMGDKSDNIPRAVPRIKQELLRRLATEADPGDVEYIVAARGATERERERISGCKTRIETNLRLVRLWSDLDMIETRGVPNRAAFLDEIGLNDLSGSDLDLIMGGCDEV